MKKPITSDDIFGNTETCIAMIEIPKSAFGIVSEMYQTGYEEGKHVIDIGQILGMITCKGLEVVMEESNQTPDNTKDFVLWVKTQSDAEYLKYTETFGNPDMYLECAQHAAKTAAYNAVLNKYLSYGRI